MPPARNLQPRNPFPFPFPRPPPAARRRPARSGPPIGPDDANRAAGNCRP